MGQRLVQRLVQRMTICSCDARESNVSEKITSSSRCQSSRNCTATADSGAPRLRLANAPLGVALFPFLLFSFFALWDDVVWELFASFAFAFGIAFVFAFAATAVLRADTRS